MASTDRTKIKRQKVTKVSTEDNCKIRLSGYMVTLPLPNRKKKNPMKLF